MNRNDERNGYEDLAIAVVKQAVREYRAAKRRYKRGDDRALGRVKEVEAFFKSSYGDVLCFGKAKEILKQLQGE